MEDEPWRNGELRRSEEGLPRFKEEDFAKDSEDLQGYYRCGL